MVQSSHGSQYFFLGVPRRWKTSQLTARMVITTQIFSIVLFISL